MLIYMTSRASNAKLSTGQTSIDRVRLSTLKDGRKCINWTGRLADGTFVKKRTFGSTLTEARRRAHHKFDQLNSASVDGQWDATSQVTDFITKVSHPHVDEVGGAAFTITSAHTALDRISTRLAGKTLGAAMKAGVLKAVLRDIAKDHGLSPATRARAVMNSHLVDLVVDAGVIDHNPIRGVPMGDLKRVAKPNPRPKRGGTALSLAQLRDVSDYLHDIDVTAAEPGRPGPQRKAFAVRRRDAAVTQLLFQLSTGLRINEARQILWSDLTDSLDGIIVNVRPEVAKGGRGRVVGVADPRTCDRLRDRHLDAPDPIGGFVIGKPENPSVAWSLSATGDNIRDLLDEVADACDIPTLHVNRSHITRATLATALAAMGVDPAQRAASLGHTVAVSDRYYNDASSSSAVTDAARALFSD